MKSLALKLGGIAALLILCCMAALGAPFAKKIPFTQPDGTQIVLWGQGDEFYAVFESQDGYTVMFNHKTRAYDYASLSADGSQLVSSGVAVGQGNPSALGLKQHLRISPGAVKKQAAERFARWDQAMGISQRWNGLKTAQRLAGLSAPQEGPAPSPPSSTTTGQKLGLTLLIDFSDAVGTIPQAEIFNYCNGDSYTGYGNNGSVKKYFLDNSNNQLTYSNVVTIYIRAPQPKTYYNNTANDCGDQGRLLIVDAVNTMKALTNYTTEILPSFSNLTVDGSSRVVAFNVFFAGGDSGVWSYGLWPHSWSLASAIDLGNGKKVYDYQITDIGTSLALGTFCHENGHMLCGFPDIYDYDYDSIGGAGAFCLMNSGGHGANPAQICAYLKRAAGWATTIALTSTSQLTASVSSAGADFNKFYRYAKPGVSTEYFLIENRQKSGRDANLPAAGIAIWHIDELGDHNNQSTNFNSSHLNYEVSLMQADNLWHFQNDVNSGDSKDLYYLGNAATGYSNRFSDATSPSARWWDGTASGIQFHHFSASGTTMTFGVGPEGPVITVDSTSLITEGCMPTNGAVDPNETVSVDFSLKNIGGRSTSNLVATLLATNGVTPLSVPQTYGALVTNGAAVARPFTFAATGACGGAVSAVLQLQDGTSNLGFVINNFALGASGSPTSANYSSGGVSVTIPDNTTVEVPIAVADAGTVADVNVRVRLNHTWDADLVLSLVHPDGTVVALANNRGSSGDNFGSGATDCSGTFTVFDDAASTAIGSGTAPFAGSYKPEDLLSTLNGKSVAGTWKLRVADTAAADVGTIYCVQLDLTRQEYVCCSGSNSAPVLTGIEGTTLNYIENQPALAVTASLTASDDGKLTNATIRITSGFASGQDVLAMSPNPQNGISAAYSSGTGVLTLTGSAIVADYQSALRSVSYQNSSDNPSTTTRSVTFSVRDEGGLDSNSQTRNIAVNSVNDLPGISGITDQSINEDAVAGPLAFTVGDAETPATNLTLSATSTNTALLPVGNIVFGGSISNRTVTAAPMTNQFGSTVVTVVVADGSGGTNSDAFLLTVNPVNDAPSFTPGSDQSVLDNAGPQTVNNWATGISAGPPNESSQTLGFLVTNSNNGLFSVPPAVSAAGTLTYVPAPNSRGVASVGVSLRDNGGTANGGVNTSPEQTFAITVLLHGQIAVLATNQDFGLVSVGANSERTFVITNLGEVTVTNGMVSAPPPFSVMSGSPFTLAGFGTTNVVVRFTPATEGSFSNNVVFSSGNGGSVTQPVTGEGAMVPVAAFMASTASGPVPLTVTFTDASTGTITNRYWNFGDGGTLNTNGTTVVHLYRAVSTNTVSLAVSGSVGTDTLTRTGYIEVTNTPWPTIITQPQSQAANREAHVLFTVVATATEPLSYQWRFNGTNLDDAMASSYTVTNVQPSDAGSYSVVVTNVAGSATSADAVLTINVPPSITAQPQSQTVPAGSNVTLTVVADGTPALAQQWFFYSAGVPGAVATSLTITNFQSTEEGGYSVRVTNAAGSVTSETAMLYVDRPVRFVNYFVNSNCLFQARLVGPASSNHVIHVSTNRFLWIPLLTNREASGIFDFTDTDEISFGKRSYRFYRAWLGP